MRNRSFVVFPLIVMCIMFAFLAIVMANNASRKRAAEADRVKALGESAQALSERDITVYWAGDFPEGFAPLSQKTVMLEPGKITEDIMPVEERYFSFTEFNDLGQVVKHSDPTDHTSDLLIVVNFAKDLTASDIEVIRKCITANNVPIFIAGKDQIRDIRKAMYKITGQYGEFDTVFYDFRTGFADHVIDPKLAEDKSVEYYQAMLDCFAEYYRQKDEAAETAEPTTFTAPPTQPDPTSDTSESETSGTIILGEDFSPSDTSTKETADGN